MKPQTLLKVLLVMSIINASFSILSGGMMALFLPTLDRVYSAHPEVLAQVPRPYYGVMALLAVLSLTGCLLMWKLRRVGFHCYLLAQLLMLLMPLLFLGKGAMGLGDIMFTALFAFYYWRLLKTLGAFSDSSESSESSENSDESELSE